MITSWKSRVLEVLLGIFTSLLFLSLNSNLPEIIIPRIFFGVLFTAAVLFYSRPALKVILISPVFIGGAFLLFELVKAVWGGSLIFSNKETSALFTAAYGQGLLFWIFQAAVFSSVFYFTKEKIRVFHFLKTLIFISLFLSLNELGPLLKNGYGYEVWPQKDAYFHPWVYQFVPFSKYIFSRWCNMNWAGDFISFGIFSGLGLVFYDLYSAVEKKERVNWTLTTSLCFITAVNAAVLFLLKSRGSLVCFAGAFLVFFLFILLKWSFRYKGIFTAVFVVFFSGFVFWAGNFKGALKEVQTLSEEVKAKTDGSWIINLEAKRRALGMFQTRPFFGVGRDNYDKFSEEFASLGVDDDRRSMANYTAMSHYYEMMAEEGSGSFIYFSFLAYFILWTSWKILTARSQFKVLAGTSLLAAVVMVLGHASINDLMERFGMITLVFVVLGVLAGLFREDFDHGA